MAGTDPGEPTVCNLTRVRGDTFPIRFQIKDENKIVIDITNFSFKLTVDPDPDPVDDGNNLFDITGVLDTPLSGIFSFTPTTGDADQTPDTYNYDVEMTDAATKIRTIIKGQWKVPQDITK